MSVSRRGPRDRERVGSPVLDLPTPAMNFGTNAVRIPVTTSIFFHLTKKIGAARRFGDPIRYQM
jgi:hypothetical protein